ncbi:MAG: NFACT family protein, partial [bacterium]
MKNIKFTSLNLHHLIEYEIKPMLPFYINKAKITEPGLISLRTSKGSTIHISTSISHPFVFVSDKRYKRTEHNFNAPLSSLVRNKKITEVKQFAMDRIFTIETSADVRIIVEMIPGRFNFLITDKSNEIINLYSYKKNREGEVILKPGAVYDFPDKQEMRQYLTTRTRRITDKEDMDIDELLKRRDFFLYRRDNSYNLFPFIDPNDEPIDRSASVSSLIETVLERESRLKKESVISGAVAGQEEKIDNLNKQIEKLRESRISKGEIEKIQEKAETLKAHLHEIKGNPRNDAALVDIIRSEDVRSCYLPFTDNSSTSSFLFSILQVRTLHQLSDLINHIHPPSRVSLSPIESRNPYPKEKIISGILYLHSQPISRP